MRNLLYIVTFFTVTPLTLAVTLFTSSALSKYDAMQAVELIEPQTNNLNALASPKYGTQVYAALPSSTGQVQGAATAADARVEIIRQYLANYKSPLEPYSAEVVAVSEKYDLDFRLLVAIAQQESNLCKKIPESSYNCWGWGIHERGTLKFASYPEALETVASGLKADYLDRGYVTPEQIMKKYTPSSPGSWAAGVNQFLGQME